MKKKNSYIGDKIHHLEQLIPLVLTIISIYLWFSNFQQNIIYFVGLTINLIGLFIWWSAKITMAENWNGGHGHPKIIKLVTKGIYSKISHPIYFGINLTLIGLSLIHLNPLWIIISFMAIIYFFRRMKLEDKYLIKKLGKKYSDYRRSTWF